MKTSQRVVLSGILLAAIVQIAATSGEGYPPYVTTKTLYAKTDLRGKRAPALFATKWFEGKAPNVKGKIMIVDFWATWCPPCRELIPEMNGWNKKFSKDVAVIGISDESADTVKTFMKTTPMTYHVGVDSTHKMYNVLGVQGIPHVMVVTPDGVVRWQGFPLDDSDRLTDDKIAAIVKAYKAHSK